MSIVKVPKCRYSYVSSDQRGNVASDLRDRDFLTHRFEYGAQREFTKHEIGTFLRVGTTITTHGHMEAGP
jgi:hypothetical protein